MKHYYNLAKLLFIFIGIYMTIIVYKVEAQSSTPLTNSIPLTANTTITVPNSLALEQRVAILEIDYRKLNSPRNSYVIVGLEKFEPYLKWIFLTIFVFSFRRQICLLFESVAASIHPNIPNKSE